MSFRISTNAIHIDEDSVNTDSSIIELRKFINMYDLEIAIVTTDKSVLFKALRNELIKSYEYEEFEDEPVELVITSDSTVKDINRYAKNHNIKLPPKSTKEAKYRYIIQYESIPPISIKDTNTVTLSPTVTDRTISRDMMRKLITDDTVINDQIESIIHELQYTVASKLIKYTDIQIEVESLSKVNVNKWLKLFPYNTIIHGKETVERDEVQSIENNSDNGACIVIDIDGTIAKHNRGPFEYEKCDTDTLLPLASQIDALSNDFTIILTTGRPDKEAKELTIAWLKRNNVKYDELMFRKSSDKRPNYLVKEDMWRSITAKHYISFIYDDDEQVIRHAKKYGLSCTLC